MAGETGGRSHATRAPAAGPLVALALLDVMGGALRDVSGGIALLVPLLGQLQQPPAFFSFFARVASFFNSGTSPKQAPRQSSNLR